MDIFAQIDLFSRVSAQEKLLFSKHLSVMIKSGIPIVEGVESLVEQTKSVSFKKILKLVLFDLTNGQSLAKSLGKHRRVFDSFYTNLIEIGEESGTLQESLDFLTQQLSKEYALRKKVSAALLYPGLVLVATTVIGAFISFFILPQLVDFFEAFGTDLPLATKILLFVANALKDYGLFIITGIIALVLAGAAILQSRTVKPAWHRFLLRLPLIGPVLKDLNLAILSRNLGILLKSGLPITRALEITANTLNQLTFKAALEEAAGQIKKGKTLSSTLEKQGKLFSSVVVKMVAVGEKTGKLEDVLIYLGDFYEDEIEEVSKNLSTILEPILLVVIGLVIGFVALAIISPIYQLTGSIGAGA